MKNILFVSPTGTLDNGAEIFITNLMFFLVQKGYNVINVIPFSNPVVQNEYIKFCEKHNIIVCKVSVCKWWWEDAPGGTAGTFEERNQFYKANIDSIEEIIDRYKIDIVISNTVNVFQGAVAAALKNKKHYWLIHEFPFGEFGYYKDKIRFLEDFSDKLYAVSGELYKAVSSLITQGTDLGKFFPYSNITSSLLKNGKFNRIVCIGRLTEGKNQLELLKAYCKIEEPVPLIFIGGWDEQYKRKCDEFISANNLSDVEFWGYKNNPYEDLSNKDICVFPSANETFGLVYIEAALHGLPIIFSDNLGHKSSSELIKTGEMYSCGNVDDLSLKIKNMLDDFDEKKVIALNRVQFIKQIYNIDEAYKELLADIEQNEMRVKSIYLVSDILNAKSINKFQETQSLAKKFFKKLLK